MRITALYVLVFALLVSCKKNKLKEFDLSYSEETTIPASTAVLNLPFSVGTPEVVTDTQSEYDSQNTASKLIDQVTLSRLSLTIKSPSAANFDFLNSVEIYLSAPDQPEIIVASKYSIPETGLKQIDMDVTGADLKDYLKQTTYSLRVRAVTDKTIASDITVQGDETFHVKARLKNLFKK